MKTRLVVFIIVLVFASVSAIPAAGKPEKPHEFQVATVDTYFSTYIGYGTNALYFAFAVKDGDELKEYVLQKVLSSFWIGKTFWWTSENPDFDTIVDLLTNGEPNQVNRSLIHSDGWWSWDVGNVADTVLFGDQVPPGKDLAGFEINRIGLQVHEFRVISTLYGAHATVHTTLIFTEIATREACMSGGWKYLERMNGTSFRNQGQCTAYVKRGK